jgi:phosphohistidine phosphatase
VKRLILLRHAKAAPKEAAEDFDRVLAPTGRSEMGPIARRLGTEDLRPDIALVSPSARTRETWDLAQGSLHDVAVSFEDRIYEAPAEQLLAVLREADGVVADGPAERVLLVGHNPGISELAHVLTGTGEGLDRLLRGMPTAALAVIDFDVEAWREIRPGEGRLADFVTPATAR